MPYGSGQLIRMALLRALPRQRYLICSAMIGEGVLLVTVGHVAGALLAVAGVALGWRMLRYRMASRSAVAIAGPRRARSRGTGRREGKRPLRAARTAARSDRYLGRVAGKETRAVEASGRTIEISNPDKVYFPELGATKFDLVSYYLDVADALDVTAQGRPALLERFPGGAGGKSFFQKRVPANAPDWLETTIVTNQNGTTSNALVIARHRPRALGGQSRLSRPPPVAVPGRRSGSRGRAPHRSRSAARNVLRGGAQWSRRTSVHCSRSSA